MLRWRVQVGTSSAPLDGKRHDVVVDGAAGRCTAWTTAVLSAEHRCDWVLRRRQLQKRRERPDTDGHVVNLKFGNDFCEKNITPEKDTQSVFCGSIDLHSWLRIFLT